MPVTFDGIRAEHAEVRNAVGIFDVSHMSEVSVWGPDATELMNRLTTNDTTELTPGGAQYACILNENGLILDDTVVYRYPDRDGYLFVPNAGHGSEMVDRWLSFAREHELSASIEDRTDETGLVAVQGPDAVQTVDSVASDSVADIPRFSSIRTTIDGVSCLVARTGYTGEDGFEIFHPVADSETVWAAFDGVQPCGLGARDTLRLEAGLLLSGEDFDPETEPRTPLEAGLGFVVDLSKPNFVGKETLHEIAADGVSERLVGIRVEGRGIARQGYSIHADGKTVGHVTSGTLSPTFEVPLALGYVDAAVAESGTSVSIEIRGQSVDATIVDQRFLNSLGSATNK